MKAYRIPKGFLKELGPTQASLPLYMVGPRSGQIKIQAFNDLLEISFYIIGQRIWVVQFTESDDK